MSAFLARRTAGRALSSARAFSTTAQRPVARITIIGNLGDTPELQATSTGHEVVKYVVASNTGPRDNRKTSWFHVASFEADGPRREFLRSLPKGSLVVVEGDAQMNQYQNAEGKTQSSLSIVQRSIDVLRRPPTDAAGTQS